MRRTNGITIFADDINAANPTGQTFRPGWD